MNGILLNDRQKDALYSQQLTLLSPVRSPANSYSQRQACTKQ